MKNQIIKKIMAYLLVGAMVITTPMTASATELENAYSTGADGGVNTGTGSGSGTSTSTDTSTKSIPLPEEIEKQLPHIVGIALDKTLLEFSDLGDTAFLQARALFDDYDAADEDMQWITKDEKERIEANIHWYSDDFSVASIGTVKNADGTDTEAEGKVGPKAEIKAVGEGTTTVYAWIEADGKQYANAPQRPTPGDFIATATVTVRGSSVTDINFDKTQVPWVIKRQYDLTKYTEIVFGKGENEKRKSVEEYSGTVTYSIIGYGKGTSTAPKVKAKATLTDAGILKVTAGNPGEVVKFAITTESGFSKEFEITLVEPNPVKKIIIGNDDKKIGLDMGSLNGYDSEKKRVQRDVSITIQTEKEGPTTDDLIWTSNKNTIAGVEGNGVSATIYTTDNIGTAKITVKSTSGKSGSITATVTATPEDIKLGDVSTYTGKAVTMPVTLIGENNLTLPIGKTKLKYEFIDIEDGISGAKAKKYYASINNKGVLTPKNILSEDGGTTVQMEKPVEIAVQVTGNLAKTAFINKKAHAKVSIKQSNLKGLDIIPMEKGTSQGWFLMDEDKKTWDKNKNKLTLSKEIYVGNTYRFNPKCEGHEEELGSIVWTSTGKGIKSAMDGVNYKTEITNNANSTIKASYIELNQTRTGKYTASKKTKTITIKPIEMAKSLVIDKPVQVVNMKPNKDATVTVKVKALNPKKAKDTIQWKVLTAGPELVAGKPQAISVGEGDSAKKVTAQLSDKNGYISVDNQVVDKDGKVHTGQNDKPWNNAKNKSIKLTIPAGTEVGSVIKVGAYAQGGAVAYAYIYVTEPTYAVEATVEEPATKAKKGKNTYDLKLGKTATITAKLKKNKNSNATETEWAWNQAVGDTRACKTEYVTYTLDKKSALVVSVDKNGKIIPKKKGKAVITIKSASGKKSTKVTINVTGS